MHRIILAEDQSSVRLRVKELLDQEQDFEVIGEADNGVDAVELTRKLTPDVLVTDLRMPGFNGIEVTVHVRKVSPNTQVIILTMYGDKVYVDAAFKAGVRGYVLKKFTTEGLIEAIRTVASGKTYLNLSADQ